MSKPAEYLTLVFRATDFAKALIQHDDCRAMSWSHALRELGEEEEHALRFKTERDALRAERDGLIELVHAAKRAIGEHCAPNDCYATGPATGDLVYDLVECPACSFLAMYGRAALARSKK